MRRVRRADRPVRSHARQALAAIAAALVVLATPTAARAHDPIILGDGQTTPERGPLLPDGTISFALYGAVGGEGDTRAFRVRFAEGDRLHLSLLIPDLPPERDLPDAALPSLELVDPSGRSRMLRPDRRVSDDPRASHGGPVTRRTALGRR
jgi:hypothetical protein